MNPSSGIPSWTGGLERGPSHLLRGSIATLVILSVVLVGMGLFALGGHPAAASPSSAVRPAGGPVTNGDLVVRGPTPYVIGPSNGYETYYQEGNITVLPGATLIVRNTTLSFVQFIGDQGTLSQRLSHIYRFVDAGTVKFYNSTLTTDLGVLNLSAKLFVSITGQLDAWNSHFEFPGWLNVAGPTATATFNNSVIAANPGVPALREPLVLIGDTQYAPVLDVTGGGEVNLFGSQVTNVYADNETVYGTPTSQPLGAEPALLLPSPGGANVTNSQFGVTANATVLAEDMLYPSEGTALTITIVYANAGVAATADVTFWYAGIGYPLGAVTFATGAGNVPVLATPALLGAMASEGVPFYVGLNDLQFAAVSAATVTIDTLSLQLTPNINYDLTVSDPGSKFNVVDGSLGLNWTPVNGTALAFPWQSNKLLVTNSATAYLANLTVPDAIPVVYSTSAVITAGGGQAFFYRWAQFNLTGRGGLLPIFGATIAAYYAYNASQSNNATANALNQLPTASPAIWGYVRFWDAAHGLPAYGESGLAGKAYVLLASTSLLGGTLPDGTFLGNYHVAVVVPIKTNNSAGFNWSVSPYPSGVAGGTPFAGSPDFAPSMSFPGYFAGRFAYTTIVLTGNGTVLPNGTVRIGQELGVTVTLTYSGTATVTSLGASLYFSNTSVTPLQTYSDTKLDLTTPGQTALVQLNWTVNETTTGLKGTTFLQEFYLTLTWNGGLPSLGGNNSTAYVGIKIAPSQVRFTTFSLPPSTLSLSTQYESFGTVQYNGSQSAVLELIATPVGGLVPVTVAESLGGPGAFSLIWYSLTNLLSPGTTYTITATATYNGVTESDPLGSYAVPASSSSVQSILFEKFLGLPLWIWLAIAAAIVAAILAVLFVSRRQAAGKLVECGECGNLIPEDATVCPKCGAEFETDLIRCSRCASTIPADSRFCPECAAQLLGKPGEGGEDAERQGYSDFAEKYRAEAKRELGENYNEGSFWDWWKRQPTYTSYSQWKLQQGQSPSRSGMSAPPLGTESAPGAGTPTTPPLTGRAPPKGGASEATAAPVPPPPVGSTAPPAAGVAAPSGSLKPCPNCGKEIPPEYLVCPFCGSVTQ